MEHEFWIDKWAKREIGFHQSECNALLVEYFDKLNLDGGARVFVPLCGGSIDMIWLLSKGFQVVGVELYEDAVDAFFQEHKLCYRVEALGGFKRYYSDGIEVYVGDFFEMSKGMLGNVDAIYDRASVVALPSPMRDRYAEHLSKLSDQASQFVISIEYDQEQHQGPPFSVPNKELQRLYSETYVPQVLVEREVPGGLKGKHSAIEKVYKLTPLRD